MSDNPVHRHIGKLMKHHQEQSFLIHSFCPDYHCDAIGFMVVLIHLVHLVGGNLKILGTELAGKGFQGLGILCRKLDNHTSHSYTFKTVAENLQSC